MKISDRLADYVVIGGFFSITQCAVLFAVGFGQLNWAVQLGNFQTLIAKVPNGAIGPLAALLGAFGLVTVFTAGVFIDLLGSIYFRSIELNAFQAHAKKNALWMQQFTNRYTTYIQDDWSIVLSSPRFRDGFRVGFTGLRLWNKAARTEYLDHYRRTFAGRKSYARMHSFLLSWVSLVGGAEKIELLNTQLSFWSISRAFATVLVLASIEVVLFSMMPREAASAHLSLVYGVYFTLLLAAIGVSRAAYSRVCGTIFALCYIADKKLEVPPDVPMQSSSLAGR